MGKNYDLPRLNPNKTKIKNGANSILNEDMFLTKFKLKLKSLEDLWICVFVLIIQLICIYRGCLSLDRFNLQSWQPYPKPTLEISVYAFLLSLSIFLLPFFVWACLLKIGSFANDNFKFGSDLDTNSLYSKLLRKHNFNCFMNEANKSRQEWCNKALKRNSFMNQKYLPNTVDNRMNFLKCSDTKPYLSSSTTIGFNRKESRSDPSVGHSNRSNLVSPNCSTCRTVITSLLSFKHFWKNFMPLSSFIHLVIAFSLVFPDILLTSKQIEYGLKPKGILTNNICKFSA